MPNDRTISGFIASGEEITAKNWHNWYIKNTLMHLKMQQKKYTCKYKIKKAINLIDYDMVKNWVEDLIINKTFNGLYFKKAILMFLSEHSRTFYKLAISDEESLGIDGYVGDTPYSIKPYI